jgi:hypothetical protein
MDPMGDPLDDLARLWEGFAEGHLRGYSPLYERIALAVAGDRGTLELVRSTPPRSHLPLTLLAAVHYLILDGLEHPLAEVYAGRSDADPGPLFLELCRTHADQVTELLARRHIQTNDCGRSALVGPGLTWLASRMEGSPALVDVGASAGLTLLCDRYRLDYGTHGATGPPDSPVEVRCRVAGGRPPIAARLPPLATRVGIDRDPVDLTRPDDARWLLACVWPDTGRLQRTTASIHLARGDQPRVIRGDALAVLPAVLAGLADETPAVVLTTWSFSYFSLEQRRQFVELLAGASGRRLIAWLSADGAGVVDDLAEEAGGDPEHAHSDVLGAVLFDRGTRHPHLLAYVQAHGQWIDWRAPAPWPP